MTIGHIVPAWLPRTETFTASLIGAMTGARHRILTTRVENLSLFPTDDLVHARSEAEYPRLVQEHGIDLLVAHFGPSGVAALPAAIVRDIPLVTLFHGYDMSLVLRDPKWVARYATLFEFGAHAVTVCEAGRQRLIAAGLPADSITTLHLGIDVDTFDFEPASAARLESGEARLLMVSRLTEKKGVHTALRALHQRRQRGGRETLTVVGAGDLHGYLLGLRGALDLNDAVQFVGAKSSSEVRAFMRESDALIQPSMTAPDGDCEGIPVVLMEAMAAGLPVVSTRHSGIPELIEDGVSGLLADEGDDAGVAAALERLATSPGLGARFAVAARARVASSFNVRTQAAAYASLLERVREDWPHRSVPARNASGEVAAGGTLFVRAAPVVQALAQVTALANQTGSQPLQLLTPSDAAMEAGGARVAQAVHVLPPGRMGLGSMDPVLLARLRQSAFDKVVIGCASDNLSDYDNVRDVAEALGAPRVVAMLPNLREVPLAARGALRA